jgi:lipopolysaccharide transport system ATP-binding protein
MTEPAISLDHIWKRFRRGYHVRTLAELVLGLPRRLAQGRNEDGLREHEFWALRDVKLDIPKGETLGIIGPNGAGKSTILKLLFNILRPDRGTVHVNGRVGGLIELGAGFHPYLSGRENVFINGAILGLKQREIRQRYDSIVEFAGLSEFMGMPVKNFSSGMYARLAFAIAAHAEPDVLLVDEVLAVGDTAFQLKCFDWIAKRRKSGGTVILVSHEMNNLIGCDSIAYIREGELRALGAPDKTIQQYLDETGDSRDPRADEIGFIPGADGKPRAEVTDVEFLGADGKPLKKFTPGEALTVRFHFAAHEEIPTPIFALTLFHDDARFSLQSPRNYLVHLYSGDSLSALQLAGEGSVDVHLEEGLHLPVGEYRAKAYIFEGGRLNPLYVRDGVARIECARTEWSDSRALIDVRQKWLPSSLQAKQADPTKSDTGVKAP